MADISKIKLPNGTEYNVKDANAQPKTLIVHTSAGLDVTESDKTFAEIATYINAGYDVKVLHNNTYLNLHQYIPNNKVVFSYGYSDKTIILYSLTTTSGNVFEIYTSELERVNNKLRWGWSDTPSTEKYPSEALILELLDNKLKTKGDTNRPVYFNSSGVATAINYTINKSVPSDAKFTDTTYSDATTSTAGLMSSSDKTKLNGIATGATANTGTVTSVAVKMNGSTKGTVTTSGTIDLGTVLTAHQDISGKLDKSNVVSKGSTSRPVYFDNSGVAQTISGLYLSNNNYVIQIGNDYLQLADTTAKDIIALELSSPQTGIRLSKNNAQSSIFLNTGDSNNLQVNGTSVSLDGHVHTTGTTSTAGFTKLYTTTGSNTDGTMTQNSITTALSGKAASSHTHTKSQITDFDHTHDDRYYTETEINTHMIVPGANNVEGEDSNQHAIKLGWSGSYPLFDVDGFVKTLAYKSHTHSYTARTDYSSSVTLTNFTTDFTSGINAIARLNPVDGMVEFRMLGEYKPTSNIVAGTAKKIAQIPSDIYPSSQIPLTISPRGTTVTRAWSAYMTSGGAVYVRSSDALTSGTAYSIVLHMVYKKEQ